MEAAPGLQAVYRSLSLSQDKFFGQQSLPPSFAFPSPQASNALLEAPSSISRNKVNPVDIHPTITPPNPPPLLYPSSLPLDLLTLRAELAGGGPLPPSVS